MNRLALIVVAFMVVGLVSTGLHAEKATKTLTGKLKAAEMYRGKVVAVYVADTKEGDFLIARSTEIGKELLHHVGSTVTVTGYIKRPRPGSEYARIIDVLEYEVIPPKVAG